MFHGVIQKITLAQFFFETGCSVVMIAPWVHSSVTTDQLNDSVHLH